MKKYFFTIVEQVQNWAHQNMLNLFIFNAILTLLLLLRSAGYFSPFFSLSISFIIALCLILSVILLGARSKTIFIIVVFFWLLTAFFMILGVNIWAERAAIYSFEALVVGILLFIFEKNEEI